MLEANQQFAWCGHGKKEGPESNEENTRHTVNRPRRERERPGVTSESRLERQQQEAQRGKTSDNKHTSHSTSNLGQVENGEKSKKALTHRRSHSLLIEKRKSSRAMSLSMYHFSKMQGYSTTSGREFTQVAFRSVCGSPCGNGTRGFSSSGLQGCHPICFSGKLKAHCDDGASENTITKPKHRWRRTAGSACRVSLCK